MTIRRTPPVRNASMDALSTQRGSDAQIQVRSGPNAGTGGQGVLLAQLTGGSVAWAGAAVDGVLSSNPITDDVSADASGEAEHYQLNTVGGLFLESGLLDTIGTDGAIIDNPTIVAGQAVTLPGSWTETAAYDDGV